MARIPTKALASAAGLLAAAGGALKLRGRSSASSAPSPSPTPAPSPAANPPGPSAAAGATPPPETPGPSVTAPEAPMSETEREERADALKPEHLPGEDPGADVDEVRVEDEAAAAAAEAAMIGGPAPTDVQDEAMRPVYEAGGGEQEGFELAEAELIENASHGDGGGNPLRDAFPAEVESDASTAVYGEADAIEPTEVVDEPDR